MVARFTDWFAQSLPILLSQRTMDFALLRKEWTHLLNRLNADIGNYGLDHNISLGTTVVAALCIGNKLYVVNIGDSRLYKIQNNVSRLTQDQSLVAREISAGKLAPDQEEKDTRRNVLLQCVGASHVLQPEFLEYTLESNMVYLLCTDGFRHEIQEEELLGLLSPRVVRSERGMQDVTGEYLIRVYDENFSTRYEVSVERAQGSDEPFDAVAARVTAALKAHTGVKPARVIVYDAGKLGTSSEHKASRFIDERGSAK